MTLEQFIAQHPEYDWNDYSVPCMVTKKPIPYANNGKQYSNNDLVDCFETPTNTVFYSLAYCIKDDKAPLPIFDDLICYIFPKLNYLKNEEGNLMNIVINTNLNNIFDFDNCAIVDVFTKTSGTGTGTKYQPLFLKYPYNATKVYEPYFYNIKKRLDGKNLDSLDALGIAIFSPKNGKIKIDEFTFTLYNFLLPYGYENAQQKFYIDYNINDTIYFTVDGEEKQWTMQDSLNFMLSSQIDVLTYDDTDIMVFNDGEYTIAQLKEKYNIS